MHLATPERRHKREHVAHKIDHAEPGEIAVVISVPSRRAAISTLVRRNDMETGLSERHNHLAPGEGEFGKAVQQQDERAVAFAAGLQDVHRQAVDIRHVARAHVFGQG